MGKYFILANFLTFLVYILIYESWDNRKWRREHALCIAIKKSAKINKIYCIPGNAGTSSIAENVSLDLNNYENLKQFIIQNNIDIVIIGPEKPLVDGLADFLEKNGIKVFGPNKLLLN